MKQIYTAMFQYSADYDGCFPLIELGERQLVGEDVVNCNRIPYALEDPFKDIPAQDGQSISQNLWLLVRDDFIEPEQFNCPSCEPAERKFVLEDKKRRGSGGTGPLYFVDFPYEKSGTTISYSFVQPWTHFKGPKGSWDQWCADADPRLPIGADANNGSQVNYPLTTMPASQPANKNDMKQYVNSTNHAGEGQNVLYGDGSISFE